MSIQSENRLMNVTTKAGNILNLIFYATKTTVRKPGRTKLNLSTKSTFTRK
jgi:hypothetical protein